jgi:hypothetical protein
MNITLVWDFRHCTLYIFGAAVWNSSMGKDRVVIVLITWCG